MQFGTSKNFLSQSRTVVFLLKKRIILGSHGLVAEHLINKKTITIGQKRISNYLKILHWELLCGIIMPFLVRTSASLGSFALASLESKVGARIRVLREQKMGQGEILGRKHSQQLTVERHVVVGAVGMPAPLRGAF